MKGTVASRHAVSHERIQTVVGRVLLYVLLTLRTLPHTLLSSHTVLDVYYACVGAAVATAKKHA